VSAEDRPIVVIGIGNVLLRDDGVGVEIVRSLERLVDRGAVELPPGTRLLDGGTLGLGLLPVVSEARAIVLVDAVDLGCPPGSVVVVDDDTLRHAPSGPRQAGRDGLGDLLMAVRLMSSGPDAMVLVGVQPSEIDTGLGLTDVMRAAVPTAVQATIQELERLGAAAASAGPAVRGIDDAEAAGCD
jgi:hydrogenase maturation protease